MKSSWSFEPVFDPLRRARLETFCTFAQIIEVVETSAVITGAWVCEGEAPGLKGCHRPVVELTVGRDAYDAFFNSPGGYRAQYLLSPENGQAANSRLIGSMEPRLSLAVAEQCGSARLTASIVRTAFLANSAKIWPDEDELDLVDATHDLAVEGWRTPCDWVNAPVGIGLWAPVGTRLMVYGAFIDPFGNEVVSRKKILRRIDIHLCGFS
jgi:hypothetical protein